MTIRYQTRRNFRLWIFVSFGQFYCSLRENRKYQRADLGIYFRGRTLSSPHPFPPLIRLPFLPLPFPLEVGSPLNQLMCLWERCKLSPAGSGAEPRKRIWCTLKLWESHWWQSFWVHVLQWNDRNLALTNMVSLQIANRQYVDYIYRWQTALTRRIPAAVTYQEYRGGGVCRPRGRGAEPALPPLNPLVIFFAAKTKLSIWPIALNDHKSMTPGSNIPLVT